MRASMTCFCRWARYAGEDNRENNEINAGALLFTEHRAHVRGVLIWLPLLASSAHSWFGRHGLGKVRIASVERNGWLVPKLLVLTFIASTGIGVFEVGLALRGKQELGLMPYQIAIMFSECSLVMFLMHAIIFSPRFKPDLTRWLISPAGHACRRLASRAAGFGFCTDVNGCRWCCCQRGRSVSDSDLLDFHEGRERTRLGIGQTDGGGKFGCHNRFGGRRNPLQYSCLSWRLFCFRRRTRCAWLCVEPRVAACACASQSQRW